MEKIIYKKDDKVIAISNTLLGDNEVAPPLELNKEYPVLDIAIDKKGNQHLDVGITSEYNYIRSFETKEELPKGHMIHWCHPSRFKLAE